MATIEDFYAVGTHRVGTLDPAQAQQAFKVGDVMEMQVGVPTQSMTMDECEKLTHACLLILNHEKSSFSESSASDNFMCVDLDDDKMCAPCK